MSQLRIKHRPDPGRPEAPDGIIVIELDGKAIALPHKGQDKIIKANGVEWQVYSEPGKDDQDI